MEYFELIKNIIINNATLIAMLFIVFKFIFEIDKSDKIKISPLKSLKHFLTGDLSKTIENNRATEIKFELSNYEKLLENGAKLNQNDIAFVREIYDEYNKKLGRNHLGTMIYEHIEEMYEKQQSIEE